MTRTIGSVVLGLLAFVVLCELLFRVLPTSSATEAGYHIDAKILTYAPNHVVRYAAGWDLRNAQRLLTNNYGFVSAHDFAFDKTAVALIGDSYVESASLDEAQRPGAQLERILGGQRAVYSLGVAGTSLLDYAERIRFAHHNFGIRDFVVLMERGDVRQSICGSGNVGSQCLDPHSLQPRTELHPSPSAAKRLLRKSAFAQYLVSQLEITPDKLLHKLFVTSQSAREQRPASEHEVDAVAELFFERVRPLAGARLVIVVDANRPMLTRGRDDTKPDTNPDTNARANPDPDPERSRFIELARAAGATVVDMEPIFKAHFKQSSLSLDVGRQDGHFNALGVALVAAGAASALKP